MEKELEYIYKHQKEVTILGEATGVLGWDQQTYMPKKGLAARAEQCALLDSLIHEKFIDKKFFSAVKKAKTKKLPFDQKRMIDLLYKDISKSRKLPTTFVEELSRTVTLAHPAWEEAREKSKFSVFQPHLEKIVKLKQKQCQYIKVKGHPYNSLLDDYEEGMTAEKIKPAFEKVKKGIMELLHRIKSSSRYKNQKPLSLPNVPKEVQLAMCKDVAQRMGLTDDVSRMDLAMHPFTTHLGSDDTRITTNIREHPMFSFGSTVHESGHALYDMQLPKKYAYTTLRNAPSMGLHESQSRFWENMIGKSKPFWQFYFPKLKQAWKLPVTEEQWYRDINYVTPGMIRIETNEIHYGLHIILRFEMELGLMDGSIKVKDLPQLWNAKMKDLFGITPRNDKEGVLQDVHWSGGSFGYFPTYTLGTIYASQLYAAMKRKIPNIEDDIRQGNYTRIREWLLENVHKHGNLYQAEDVIKKVCGEGLNPNMYIKYLTDKYTALYEC
ncbi:MAG: carboxypeptidase M32 [Nanoarchaeota archaeon]